MAAANGVQNMSLAHEIAVNNDFQLEKIHPEANSIEKQVRDVMHRAFWDALESKLNDSPPDFSHALVLIEEVKESLLALLLPQHVRLRAQIMEVLDMDLIRQKINNEAFDIYFYADYVIGTMARLCAPIRDERVASLKELKDVVPLFRQIFEVLDLMKMDMANFTIQQIRPYLQQQSVEYERKKFNELVATQEEHGGDALEATKLWLKRNYQRRLSEENSAVKTGQSTSSSIGKTSPSPSSTSALPSKDTPVNILNEAYMETLQWDYKHIYPETLLMDKTRFFELDIKGKMLTTIAAVQLVTYSTVGAPIADIATLKTTLKSHVQSILEGDAVDLKMALQHIAEQVKKDVDECLVQHSFSAMDSQKAQLLQGQICDLASPANTVMKLTRHRMMEFIKESISNNKVDPLKVPTGFTAVEKELSEMLGQFLRLISHNRSVFGPHYSDIISSILQRHQDLSPR